MRSKLAGLSASPSGMQALRFLENARKHLDQARATGDLVHLRKAAEFEWGAVREATRLLLQKRGIRPKMGTRRMGDAFSDLAAREPRLNPLFDLFGRIMQYQHGFCFGEGECSAKMIERDFKRVEEYLETIARL